MTRRAPPPLVALTPGDLAAEAVPAFLERARAAAGAGLAGILVREPEMGDRALLALARAVRGLLPPGGWLGLHDRVHLAGEAGADAVHLGFRSLAPSEARPLLAEGIAVGLSAHAGDDPAAWSAADYLFFGPVLATPSKRGLLEPVGFEGLARAAAASPCPVWAIGGLRPEHAAGCLAAGAAGLAVLAGILRAPDRIAAAAACAEYARAIAVRG